jgi:hypothetical protein
MKTCTQIEHKTTHMFCIKQLHCIVIIKNMATMRTLELDLTNLMLLKRVSVYT